MTKLKEEIKKGCDPVNASMVLPAKAQHFHHTRHQYGWEYEHILPNESLKLLFLVGSLPYLAFWLLPFAGAVRIIEPDAYENAWRHLRKKPAWPLCK